MAGDIVIRIILMLLLPALFGAGSAYAQNGDAFRPLHDIEDALDPIDFANYDGVRYYGIDLSIPFAFDSARILPEAAAQLEALAQALSGERLQGRRFRVIGHTDGVGADAYNLALSQRRADSVRAALIEKGIAPERLETEGKGFTQPRPSLPPEAAEHRRVEVRTLPDAPSADSPSDEPEPDTGIQW